MTTSSKSCDVLVLGGGPAGSSIAAILAEKGWQVDVWEKDPHPRFHIGESLLPHTLPFLKQLGVLEEVERIGLKKFGAELVSPYHDEPVTLYFSGAWDKSHPYAFQVRRSEFDDILLRNCRKKGVRVREGLKAKNVSFSEEGLATVHGVNAQGKTVSQQARYVVDATGRQTFLANHFHAYSAIHIITVPPSSVTLRVSLGMRKRTKVTLASAGLIMGGFGLFPCLMV